MENCFTIYIFLKTNMHRNISQQPWNLRSMRRDSCFPREKIKLKFIKQGWVCLFIQVEHVRSLFSYFYKNLFNIIKEYNGVENIIYLKGEKVLSDIFDDSHYYFVVIMNK